jgi:hypothetical protein
MNDSVQIQSHTAAGGNGLSTLALDAERMTSAGPWWNHPYTRHELPVRPLVVIGATGMAWRLTWPK